MTLSWDLAKGVIQIAAWVAAIVFGTLAARRANIQSQQANEQRRRDLHWRQAKETIAMVDAMWENKYASSGLRMISHHKTGKKFENFDVDGNPELTVKADKMIRALKEGYVSGEYLATCLSQSLKKPPRHSTST